MSNLDKGLCVNIDAGSCCEPVFFCNFGSSMLYAEIILPIAGGVYTFSVDGELAESVTEGCAVSVQFGGGERGRKIVTGIVRRVHSERPAYKKIKPVLALLFPEPVVDAVQMRLWEWMAEYYMCTLGEVMRSALPSMLKPSGFSAEEFAADEFRPSTVRLVSLSPYVADEAVFNETCEKLRRRAPKQYEALVEVAGHGNGGVPRPELNADSVVLAALQKKELIVFSEQESPQNSSLFSPFTILRPTNRPR